MVQKPPIEILSEEPGGIVLSLEAPAVEWTRGGGYVYPMAAGWPLSRRENAPALPVRVERVAVPPGAAPSLTILEAETAESAAGVVGPVQRWVPILPGSSDRAPLSLPDPTLYARDELYPSEEPVRLGSLGFFREQAFVELIFTPVLHNPARGASITYRSVTVRIDFGVAAAASFSEPDAEFEGMYERAIVNARQGRSFRLEGKMRQAQADDEDRFALATSAPLTAKYKLTVNRDGVYRLDVAWVQANASELLSQNPARYRLDCLGLQVPIRVVDSNSDGTFNGSDFIEFFGQRLTWDILAPDAWNGGDYTDDNIYWLYAESGAVSRIPTRASAPTGGYPIPLDFSETLRHDVNSRFVPLVPSINVEHWYQEPPVVANGSAVVQSFTVNTPGLSTDTATASVKVRLLGDTYVNNFHRSAILVNGTTVAGPTNWDGFREFTHGVDDGTASFSQSILNDGTPESAALAVSLPLGRTVNSNPITRDIVFMNWIEMTYGRRFRVDTDDDGDGTVLDDQRLIFSAPNQNTQFRITGFSQNAAAVYDITRTLPGSPLADPVLVTGGQFTGAAAPYRLDFQMPIDTGLPGGTKRRFAVATTTASTATGDLVPAAARRDVPSNLRTPSTGADWLVVANASLLDSGPGSAWQQLLARRAAQGLRVVVVDVEDVYDEFSFGISDPQGIRDFIAHVYANWPRTIPTVPVRYVLMIGDASFDYENNLKNAQNKNLLSTYMRSVPQSSVLGWMSDETYFAAVSGPDDIPDLYLGRWPTHSVAETNAVAQKILNYETAPAGQAWQRNLVFVADDDEAAFEQIQDAQIANYLAGTAYTSNRTYEGRIKAGNPTWATGCCPAAVAAETRDRIQRQLNGQLEPGRDIGPGAVTMSYVGHGSWLNWGSNFSFVLTSSTAPDDVDSLSNGTKLPLIVVANCLSGGFTITSGPGASTDLTYSLGEDFLVTAGKGAIGVIAPSHLTFTNGHATVENSFFAEAFGPRRSRKLGNLNMAIQLGFAADGDPVNMQSYMLIGDPAATLAAPAPKPPTNVAATPGNRQVTVSWTASPEAATYSVYQSTQPAGMYLRVGSGIAGTSFVATNLANCTTYHYVVVSVSSDGIEGAWSHFNDGCSTGGTCVRATPRNPSAPSAPAGVTATDNETGGAVRVQWAANPPSNEVTEYRVYWSTTQGSYPQWLSAGPATSFLVTGLTDNVTYYFAVSGVNCSQGEGPKSSPGVAAVPRRIYGIKPPKAIGDLRIFRHPDPSDGIDDVRLQWTPPTTNIYGQPTTVASQEIYRGSTPNFPVNASTRLATVSGTTSSYIHPNAYRDGANHHYLIVAIDSQGQQSGISRELPRGIDQLTIRRQAGNLNLSWPAVSLDIDGRRTIIARYQLYGRATPFRRSEIAPGFLLNGNITAAGTTVPIPAGTVFYYSVIAVDDRGALSPW